MPRISVSTLTHRGTTPHDLYTLSADFQQNKRIDLSRFIDMYGNVNE
jgi:hypothetical protein